MASTEVTPARSFVVDEYERSLSAIPYGPMPLEVYEDKHSPKQFRGHQLLNAYLEADWESDDPVERMTGRMADIAVTTGSSSLAGDHEALHLSAVDLRAAPGSVFLDFAKDLHRRNGGKKPWFFNDLDGGAQFFKREYRKSDRTDQWVHVASIGDDHPINELPVFIRPSSTSSIDLDVDYGCPPQVVEMEWNRMRGEDISYDVVLEGLHIQARMMAEQVNHPTQLSTSRGEKVRESGVNAWLKLPQRDDVVSYVWRAYGLAKSVEESGFKNALNHESMKQMIMGTMAYARGLENIMRRGTLAARIGIIDVNDGSMSPLIMQLVGEQADLRDPEVRKKVHGSLYIRQNSQTTAPIMYSNGDGRKEPVKNGFKLFLNSPDSQAPYRGFQTWDEVADEFAGRTKIKGAPKMPIRSMVHFASSATDSRASYGNDLLVMDPFSSGAFMETFVMTAPWVANHIKQVGMNFTVEDILKGRFAGSTRGTEADMLADCAFALISRSGDTTDKNGARKGYRIVTPIEKGRAAAINVSYPTLDEAITITEGSLIPEKQIALAGLTKRRQAKAQNQLVIGHNGAEPQLAFDQVDGHHAVVSIFSDGNHQLYIQAFKDRHNKDLPANARPVPVPKVTVAAPKPKALG